MNELLDYADSSYERGRRYGQSDGQGFAAGLFGALTAGWYERDPETAESLAHAGERVALREAMSLAAAYAVGEFLRLAAGAADSTPRTSA